MKKHWFIYSISICLLLYIIMILPVDYAVYKNDLPGNKQAYYIVEWEQITGASWKIIGDQDGYYNKPVYVNVDDDLPLICKLHLASGGNKYICRGTFSGESEINNIYNYDFDTWNILYPIQRNSLFNFLPDRYVCLMDLIL